MNKETLFEALSDVGDDLLVMAEHKRFVSPWRRWGQTAAVLAVVVCLSALAVPYLGGSCGQSADMAYTTAQAPMSATTTESARTETASEVLNDSADEGSVAWETADEEMVEESEPQAEEETVEAEETPDLGAQQVQIISPTKIVCRGTYFYVKHDVEVQGVPPLGEELGEITWSDDASMVGRTVYTVPYSTWFSNYAVNGEPVTQQIYIRTPSGYLYGVTCNEKIVSRYTMDDVRLAINKANDTWLTDTFVLPIERQGSVEFTDPSELSAWELETMFWASTAMNTGVVVADIWFCDKDYRVPVEDLLWRLERVLDAGFVYESTQSNWYDAKLDALVYPLTKVKYDHMELKLQDAEITDENHLVLTAALPDGALRQYTIRFGEDAWRYESIVTIQ